MLEFPSFSSLELLKSFDSWWWLSLTCLIYLIAAQIFKRFSSNILFHPILVGALMVMCLCALLQIPVADYLFHVQPLGSVLSVVTVALAVPLYLQIRTIFAAGVKGLAVILAGGCIAPLCTFYSLKLFGFSEKWQLSALTKSITTPLAIDTSAQIGGPTDLSAAIVVITGIAGVMAAGVIFRLTRNRDPRSQGLTLGCITHAIGTARAQQHSQQSGAFATLALCINGILTAIVLPLLFFPSS